MGFELYPIKYKLANISNPKQNKMSIPHFYPKRKEKTKHVHSGINNFRYILTYSGKSSVFRQDNYLHMRRNPHSNLFIA